MQLRTLVPSIIGAAIGIGFAPRTSKQRIYRLARSLVSLGAGICISYYVGGFINGWFHIHVAIEQRGVLFLSGVFGLSVTVNALSHMDKIVETFFAIIKPSKEP